MVLGCGVLNRTSVTKACRKNAPLTSAAGHWHLNCHFIVPHDPTSVIERWWSAVADRAMAKMTLVDSAASNSSFLKKEKAIP